MPTGVGAHASGGHPLLSASARALGGGAMTWEQAVALLQQVAYGDAVEEHPDGSVTTTSGVWEVERERFTPPARVAPEQEPVLGARLAAAVGDPEPVAVAVVIATAEPMFRTTWGSEAAIRMLTGEIASPEAEPEARRAWIAAREQSGHAAIDAWLDTAGAVELVRREPFTPAVVVRAAPAQAAAWADPERVTAVELAEEATPDAGHPAGDVPGPGIDGFELMDLLQSWPLYARGYFGSEEILMSEGGATAVRRRHPGLDDEAGADRYINCVGSGATCTSNPDPDPGDGHATKVAGLLAGDISHGQHPSIDPCDDTAYEDRPEVCHEYSGVARGATVRGDSAGSGRLPSLAAAFGNRVVSRSTSTACPGEPPDLDCDCSGASSADQAYDALFEAGVAVFNSDRNNEHVSTTACTTARPATAIGVFASSPTEVLSGGAEVMSSYASRGGTATHGGPRTIKSIAIPGGIGPVYCGDTAHAECTAAGSAEYDEDGTSPSGYGAVSSWSTPVLAGAATLFREWYLDTQSTLVNDPGILYTNLLLMGDRTTQSGLATSGFDNLWGAGALRLRTWDPEGLDGPARWATHSTCVGDGENVYINITPSGPLDPDVDYVKAVIWWYDAEFDANADYDLDDVDLHLQRSQVSGFPPRTTWTTLRSSTGHDHKQHVFYRNLGSWELRLRIQGNAISTVDQGCGADHLRVYYAYVWEENERDDDALLSDHVRPW